MKTKLLNIRSLAAAAFLALGSSTAQAVLITPSNAGGNGITDNVLFNNGALLHGPGLLVQGDFAGGSSGAGYIVDFTSSSGTGSGTGMLQVSGGQASLVGATGNDPFRQLCFFLEGGATFTQAILNPDAVANGTIVFTVDYIVSGVPFTQTFPLDGNGNNFFHVDAQGSERITKVCFLAQPVTNGFSDSNQIRIGGFQPGRVPDGGTTLLLLGASLTVLESLRRRLLKRSSAA